MKFKKILAFAMVALVICTFGYLYADSKISYSEIHALQVSHKTLDELEERSELILSGRPISSENHVIKDENGFIEEGYTITSFKVDNVNSNKGINPIKKEKIIKVAEPVYIVENGIKPGKTEFALEDYVRMEKDKRYLLTLKPDLKYPDLYVIVGASEGKYSLDNSNEKAGKFKEELINKYKIK